MKIIIKPFLILTTKPLPLNPEMKTYTVHLNLNHANPLETVAFVKEGFAWFAMILHVLWFIYHKMWFASVVLFLIEVTLMALQTHNYMPDEIITALKVGLFLFIGFNFNDFRRYFLGKNGYILYTVIIAKNEDEACYKFLSDMVQRSTFGSGQAGFSLV